jgi:hypothetical protein
MVSREGGGFAAVGRFAEGCEGRTLSHAEGSSKIRSV